MSAVDCECELSGYCERYKRRMLGPEHAICRGISSISDSVRSSYIAKWEREADTQSATAIPAATTIIANHRERCLAGSELKTLLSWFGQRTTSGCRCQERVGIMNAKGCDWCEQNIETIVGWLAEEAEKRKLLGFSLASVPGFDITAEALVKKAIANAREKTATHSRRKHPFAYSGEIPPFITLGQLGNDVQALASQIPPETKGIIGIARSGLVPATMLAQLLHLPLKILRQHSADGDYSLLDGGSGWRLSGNIGGDGSWVLVDDTVMSGNSFSYSLPPVFEAVGEVKTAALYVNPHSRFKPDYYAHELPWPHLLEWNMFNSVMTPSMAFDFDGILCHDCPAGSDDDGQRYLEFLRNTKPLYPVRKVVIPLIVTARLEKYRSETIGWLKRHGMAVDKLVMGPWKSLRERTFDRVCEHKATAFQRFIEQKHRIKPPMFVESCPHQAKRIADLSGGLVVCPAAGRCFAKGDK